MFCGDTELLHREGQNSGWCCEFQFTTSWFLEGRSVTYKLNFGWKNSISNERLQVIYETVIYSSSAHVIPLC